MKKLIYITLSALVFGGELTPEILYFKYNCNSCHGMYGEGMGENPKLQGKKSSYLLKRLKELKNGKTKTINGSIMISFAKSLDSNQTAHMATYLSGLKNDKTQERYDEEYDPFSDGGS